jgi:hypothetical protein
LTDVQDLASRLQLLEDERGIRATLYRYGHSIDYGLEEEWVDCFLPDGRYVLRYPTGAPAGRTPRVFQGRGEIAGFVAAHSRAPQRYHKHLLVEPVIAIDGDRATVSSYFVRVDAEGTQRVILAFGRYLDTMLRCADGLWRFAERIAEVESIAPAPSVG